VKDSKMADLENQWQPILAAVAHLARGKVA